MDMQEIQHPHSSLSPPPKTIQRWLPRWLCKAAARKPYKTVTLSPPPNTYCPLPLLCDLVFPSPSSQFPWQIQTTRPRIVTTLTMNRYWAHCTQKSQSQEKDFGQDFQDSHTPISEPCQQLAAQPPSSLVCVRTCPGEKGQRAKRDTMWVTLTAHPKEASFSLAVPHSLSLQYYSWQFLILV
jgi:hypothetical protein